MLEGMPFQPAQRVPDFSETHVLFHVHRYFHKKLGENGVLLTMSGW
jgi:hypothetical protein